MPAKAKAFIALVIAAGVSVLLLAASTWSPASLPVFWAFLAFTLIASTLKIRIPGMSGTMSPNFAFLLIGMVSLTTSEVVVASFVAALLQCVWRPKQRLRLVQVLFSAATLPVGAAISYWCSHAIVHQLGSNSPVALVLLAGCFYLALNTTLVSLVIALVEGQNLKPVWQNCYECVFPCFLVGVFLTGLLAGSVSQASAWEKSLFLLPVLVLSHLYFLSRHKSAPRQEFQAKQFEKEEDLLAVSSARK